jgi:DNA-binding transcriptional MerR regulator
MAMCANYGVGGAKVFLVSAERLVTTGEAARALHVHPRTFRRWYADGWITPSDTTGGGHYRWDIEKVRGQLHDRRQHQD